MLKEFFHDKIDWKFVNYLTYELTKLEDTGAITFSDINILIGRNDSPYAEICHVKDGQVIYRSYGNNNLDVIEKYKNSFPNIYYRVTINDFDVFLKLVEKVLSKRKNYKFSDNTTFFSKKEVA